MIKEWKESVSGLYLRHEWKKNAEYYRNMRELRLVPAGSGSRYEGYEGYEGYERMGSDNGI